MRSKELHDLHNRKLEDHMGAGMGDSAAKWLLPRFTKGLYDPPSLAPNALTSHKVRPHILLLNLNPTKNTANSIPPNSLLSHWAPQ